MSVMAAHIRVLRALADSAMTMGSGESQHNHEFFHELGWVIRRAADKLEAEEPKFREETPVNYNPKGKR